MSQWALLDTSHTLDHNLTKPYGHYINIHFYAQLPKLIIKHKSELR